MKVISQQLSTLHKYTHQRFGLLGRKLDEIQPSNDVSEQTRRCEHAALRAESLDLTPVRPFDMDFEVR